MTGELKAMFEAHLTEPMIVDTAEKQRIENEEKKKKEYIKKQTGMKREFIKLVGGIPGIIPTDSSKHLGKGDRVQRWVWSKFRNPARTDTLLLTHWQRKEDVEKDYEYAQLNKKINLVEFTPEEFETQIKPLDPNWSYEETLYLWELLRQFDLRFIVVHDRYDGCKFNKERTIEELKDRYYSISRKLLEQRKIYEHPILKSGYNYEQEMKRRAYLERTMNKSIEEFNQETSLLKQAETIEKKIEKYEKLEDNLKNLNTENRTGMTFEEYIKNNASESDSFVYLRSQKLKHPLPISEKLQRKVDAYMKELGIPEKLVPTIKVEQSYDILRNNLVIYTSLKKHLEKKEKELSSLQQKLQDMQTKVPIQRSVVSSNAVSQQAILLQTNPPATEKSMDMLSVSSVGRDRSKKNSATPNKIRKRKANDEPQLESASVKKRKKGPQK